LTFFDKLFAGFGPKQKKPGKSKNPAFPQAGRKNGVEKPKRYGSPF